MTALSIMRFNEILAALSFVLTPVLVLAGAYFWTRKANPLSAAEVFGLLAIVNVASEPFMTLLNSFMLWSGGLASLGRIQKFLCLDEVHDMREAPADLTGKTHCSTSEKKVQPSGSRPTHFAVEFDLVAVTSALMGPILTQVSLRIPWGALAILWGPINCGKSTLLKCILGETKLDAGVVKVGTKSIAYCSQETWLQNGTLRGNVIGVLNYVEARYRQVITCCGLDPDIASFPNGDQFMTGTGGCNLSGGQKQRVVCFTLHDSLSLCAGSDANYRYARASHAPRTPRPILWWLTTCSARWIPTPHNLFSPIFSGQKASSAVGAVQ